MHLLAIDPGDVHNGVAYLQIRDIDVVRHWTADVSMRTLESLVESANIDMVVIEEFRLYPELAREQGYSDFPTVERIGIVKYIVRKRGLTHAAFVQGAGVKRQARRIGERLAPEQGKVRMLGSARSRYQGWDYNAKTQHERDATAHGVWFAYRNRLSSAYEADLNKETRSRFECRT